MHISQAAAIGRGAWLVLVMVLGLIASGCLDAEPSPGAPSHQEDGSEDLGPCAGAALKWHLLEHWEWSSTPVAPAEGDDTVAVAEEVVQLRASVEQRGTRVAGAWDVRVTDEAGQERLAFVDDSGLDVIVGDNVGGHATRAWSSTGADHVDIAWEITGMVDGVRLKLEAATC